MKIGIVGASGHTHDVLEGARTRSDLEIVGVAPGSEGEDVGTLYEDVVAVTPDATQYDTFEQLVAEAAPELLVVTCQFGDLATVSAYALERDIHVFTEKPVATTFEGLDDVRSAHERSSGQLAAMLGMRYSPRFATAHRRMSEGAIGDIRMFNARKSYKLGTRDEFYRSRSSHGGTIPWVGIHAVDWINWFATGDFQSVHAVHSTVGNRGYGDLEATALAQFELTDDVVASVSMDYLRPAEAPTHGDDRLRVVGTEGILEVEGGGVFLTNGDAAGRRQLSPQGGGRLFEQFVRQVRGEGTCRVNAEDSFVATEAVLRARQSADDGRIVRFD